NFASAFYRMMDEPVSRQRHVPELNRLLIQNHTLASQIAAVIPHLALIDDEPAGIRQALAATQDALAGRDASPPNVIETEGDYAALAYPLRQMIKAAQRIDEEMRALQAPPDGPAARARPATAG
ncbi:MAG: FUSC family protein, partial [Castellaniella sp.]